MILKADINGHYRPTSDGHGLQAKRPFRRGQQPSVHGYHSLATVPVCISMTLPVRSLGHQSCQGVCRGHRRTAGNCQPVTARSSPIPVTRSPLAQPPAMTSACTALRPENGRHPARRRRYRKGQLTHLSPRRILVEKHLGRSAGLIGVIAVCKNGAAAPFLHWRLQMESGRPTPFSNQVDGEPLDEGMSKTGPEDSRAIC